MSSSMISLSGWRPSRVRSVVEREAVAGLGAGAHDEHGGVGRQLGRSATTTSSSVPGASCSGSTARQRDRAVAVMSSGEPQLEQKLLSGGLRCPQWLQNTYATLSPR